MRQEKEISKNFYRFWRMSNLRGFLGRCAKVVANSKYFYNFGSMRQNVGELRKKSSPKFGFAKRCRIDPKFGASTQKASQIRHSPKFALFSGFKLWRIVRSPKLFVLYKIIKPGCRKFRICYICYTCYLGDRRDLCYISYVD